MSRRHHALTAASARCQPRALAALLTLLCALLLTACGASYDERVRKLRADVQYGDLSAAIDEANAALGVDRAEQMPAAGDALTPLLLLERATLLQASGEHRLSARDFQEADAGLELLDLSQSTAQDFAQYLFSDAMGDYQTPPYEKLLVNAMNLLNYLALGDLDGARVEARRIGVLEAFFEGQGEGVSNALGLGAYLAGFVHEQRGEVGEALRWYGTATRYGDFPTAEYAIGYLMKQRALSDDHLQAVAAAHPDARPPAAGEGELLVVIEAGLAPHREPERVPIGLALTLAASDGSWRHSPAERARADRLAVEGLFKWVNFPALVLDGGGARSFRVTVPGARMAEPELVLDVEAQAVAFYEAIKPKIAIAAITRLLTRTAASALTEQAVRGNGQSGGQAAAGFLIGKILEGAMVVADVPDTRSWNTLPRRFWLLRARVPAGQHQVVIELEGGQRVTRAVDLAPGGWGVVVFRAF